MPILRRRIPTAIFAGCLTFSLFACGEGAPAGKGSIAKALAYESKQRAAAEADDKRREAEAKARIEAEKAADAKLMAELDAVAIVPEDGPKDLAKACDQLVDAYDAFMKRGKERAVFDWNEDHLLKLGRQRTNCIQRKSLKIASCQINALTNAPAGFDLHDGPETARRVMLHCVEKFGGGAAPDTAPDEKGKSPDSKDAK
jgi:hypothetical protein